MTLGCRVAMAEESVGWQPQGILSEVVAEGIQSFRGTHMAAEVAENKPVGPKEPGLRFYKEDTECR